MALKNFGAFHTGYQLDGVPQSLSEFRVTTGDEDVAVRIQELFGGEGPTEWETKSERNLQVFTDASSIDVIVSKASDLRQRMILWGRDGKPIYVSDGEFILDENGHPTDDRDPDADLTFQERKDKKNIGAVPSIELTFRVADDPDLGIFQFRSGSWGLAHFLAAEGIEDALQDIDGPAVVRLKLIPVSFKAKNGPMKGKTVSYTSTEVEVIGAAAASVEDEATDAQSA